MTMTTYAIIPAAGIGKRITSEIPKQFIKVNGKEIIAYTLELFQQCTAVDEIIIATRKDYFDLLNSIKEKYSITKLSRIVEGGKERQDSVYAAIKSIPGKDDDILIVHDAARPLLNKNLLSAAIDSAKKIGSVVVAVRAKDTLIEGSDSVEKYIDRSKIYYAQTPQIFKYKILIAAMGNAYKNNFIGTDESMIVKMNNQEVKIVEGNSFNFKITTDSDLELFKKLLS